MFYVINKEKLKAYTITIATVFVLFVMAGVVNPDGNSVETAANIQNEVENNLINTTNNNGNSTSNEIINKNLYETYEKTE